MPSLCDAELSHLHQGGSWHCLSVINLRASE